MSRPKPEPDHQTPPVTVAQMGPTALAPFLTYTAHVFALFNIWPGMSLGNHDDNLVHRDVKLHETLQPRKEDTLLDHVPISNLGPGLKIALQHYVNIINN